MSKCPDCSHPMTETGEVRKDILTKSMKPVLKCSQCRLWIFKEDVK